MKKLPKHMQERLKETPALMTIEIPQHIKQKIMKKHKPKDWVARILTEAVDADRVEQIRKIYGMRKGEFAEFIGCSMRTLKNWELSNPPDAVLFLIEELQDTICALVGNPGRFKGSKYDAKTREGRSMKEGVAEKYFSEKGWGKDQLMLNFKVSSLTADKYLRGEVPEYIGTLMAEIRYLEIELEFSGF